MQDLHPRNFSHPLGMPPRVDPSFNLHVCTHDPKIKQEWRISEFASPSRRTYSRSIRWFQTRSYPVLARWRNHDNLIQVAGDLGEESDLIDPTNNKYEVASQLIIHLGRRYSELFFRRFPENLFISCLAESLKQVIKRHSLHAIYYMMDCIRKWKESSLR